MMPCGAFPPVAFPAFPNPCSREFRAGAWFDRDNRTLLMREDRDIIEFCIAVTLSGVLDE